MNVNARAFSLCTGLFKFFVTSRYSFETHPPPSSLFPTLSITIHNENSIIIIIIIIIIFIIILTIIVIIIIIILLKIGNLHSWI